MSHSVRGLGVCEHFLWFWRETTLCSPMDCSRQGNSPGKNTGPGGHPLLQGIFLTQGLNLGLLHFRQILLPSEPPGNPQRKSGKKMSDRERGLECVLAFLIVLERNSWLILKYTVEWGAPMCHPSLLPLHPHSPEMMVGLR